MKRNIFILLLSLIGVCTINADNISDLMDSNRYIFVVEKRNSYKMPEYNQPYNWVLIQNDTIIYQTGVAGAVTGSNWHGGTTLMSNVAVQKIEKTDKNYEIEYRIYGTYLNGSFKIKYDYSDVYAELSINKHGFYSYYFGRIIPIGAEEIIIGKLFGSM